MRAEDSEILYAAIAGIGLLVVVLLIWLAVVSRKLSRLTRQYRAMIGSTGVADLETVISSLQQRTADAVREIERLTGGLSRLEETVRQSAGRIGIVRYNAFAGQGSDLSFAVAIVNEERSGVVLSGIHSREETYVYAKPVKGGESTYPLTPEERQAIEQAGLQPAAAAASRHGRR
ncbi:MAG: DUF4446 domain-containing protein [Thermobacillus sp.]|uniref:DUF4446 family protein n=1 Tax=Thermobacillus composti (strain DSM 18247 / JCM 13945 / KWC4) TaxID=717605 RepID=L0EIZ1_THECK|nr:MULTISPECIES: DUF4446 family protein [Thermobacillus]AGA59787.1 hypothetical protein Theco_3771 [Thermobacillus composti KWC4]REK53508.1 MAG: DUF4446 domain-containing protein [Thermobacillus sp.]